MTRMALGFGIPFPAFLNPVTNSFSSMAFMGEPCPRKRTGISAEISNASVILRKCCRFIAAPVIGRSARAWRNFLRFMNLLNGGNALLVRVVCNKPQQAMHVYKAIALPIESPH
jgi:hypothetical protein